MRTDVTPVAVADSLPFGCHCSCVISAWPEQPETSDTCFIPAVPFTGKTAYTVVLVVVAEPCTGLFAADDPVNKIDPSGNDAIDEILTLVDVMGTFGATASAPSVGSVMGTGGPDITKALNRTLLDVQAEFWGWSRDQKIQAAVQMRDLFDAAAASADGHFGRPRNGAQSGALNAWDIIPLFEVGFNLQDGNLVTGGQKYFAGSGMAARTVAFNGRCYYASAVNYALWGTMNRCVYDWLQYDQVQLPGDDSNPNFLRDEYSLDNAIHTARAFKHWEYNDFGPIEHEAEEFTAYGFNGAAPSWAMPFKPSGASVPEQIMNWCWEPVKPR
jgi:hypothetical protein